MNIRKILTNIFLIISPLMTIFFSMVAFEAAWLSFFPAYVSKKIVFFVAIILAIVFFCITVYLVREKSRYPNK